MSFVLAPHLFLLLDKNCNSKEKELQLSPLLLLLQLQVLVILDVIASVYLLSHIVHILNLLFHY